MTRLLGTALAASLTTVSAAGILALIAYDFLGDGGMCTVWKATVDALARPPTPTVSATAIDGFKPRHEIHFFEQAPVKGTDLIISTGAAYASVEAVEARRPLRQWCYINIESPKPGIQARVDLGSQRGDDAPIFTSKQQLAAAGLEGQGLNAERLADLARSHCRFGKLNPLG